MLALVIVDLQRWMFRLPERMAQVSALLANTERLADAFREVGLPIYDVRTVHKADRSTWSRLMLKHDYACLIEGTADADAMPGYEPPPTAIPIIKTANSAFLKTDFAERLSADQVSEVTLAGVFLDGCIGLTATDAAQRGFAVSLVSDAVGHTKPERRAPLLEWLSTDFDIAVLSTREAVDRVKAEAKAR
jgi:nicotinamidase-related amidase